MIVAFRADASPQIGGGHLARCLALAEALRKHGADIHFIMRDGIELSRHGVTLHVLERDEPDEVGTRRILQALAKRPTWLVIDHYGLCAPWERKLTELVEKTLVIDDLADRPHDCDVLIDQSSLEADRYAALVPPRCLVFVGLERALLRREFAEARSRLRERAPGVRAILVSLGGADPDNVTLRVIDGYRAIEGGAPPLVVVAGPHNPHVASLREACAGDPRISLLVGVDRMSEILVECDLAIGALGVSTWERCCLGVPSLVVGLTPPQNEIAGDLARRGIVRYLGPSTSLGPTSFRASLLDALHDPAPVREMAARAHAIVDGRGADRVAELMVNHV